MTRLLKTATISDVYDQVIESSSSSEYNGIVIESNMLFKNDNAIRIVHGNEIYTLRITQGDKLVLIK